MKKNYLLDLMRSKQTVFTTNEVALIWEETNFDLVRTRMSRYLRSNKIHSIRRGIYAKDENYDKHELAIKIFVPSYISFETVLARSGLIFQYYSQIFAASYLTRTLEIDDQTYSYRKLKDSVLTNHLGVEVRDNCSIASVERAFLDTVYLNKDYYFDNLNGLDWDRVNLILPVYGDNQRMKSKLKKYREETQSKG